MRPFIIIHLVQYVHILTQVQLCFAVKTLDRTKTEILFGGPLFVMVC